MARRIVIVSEDLVEPWDEGIKKFTFSLGRALSSRHAVRMINVDRSGLAARQNGATPGGDDAIVNVPGSRTFMQPALRRAVASAQPDTVIYVPSPSDTAGSFVRAFSLRRHWPRARHAMVALIPRRHPSRLKPFLKGAAPDCVFVPSYVSLLHLHNLSLSGDLLPVGIDLARFRPAAPGEKNALRRKHGVPEGAHVFLHVGHLRPKRNLGVLARLAGLPGAHVIAIGSTSTPEDAAVRNELERAGVRVIREFVPVDEFHRLADRYVFPVFDSEGCVEIPLSVIEALASGVPVIARPFGGLRDVVPAGDDVCYVANDDEMLAQAAALMQAPVPPVRALDEFAWDNVADRLLARLHAEQR